MVGNGIMVAVDQLIVGGVFAAGIVDIQLVVLIIIVVG